MTCDRFENGFAWQAVAIATASVGGALVMASGPAGVQPFVPVAAVVGLQPGRLQPLVTVVEGVCCELVAATVSGDVQRLRLRLKGAGLL